MNLHPLLLAQQAAGKPVTVAPIGAGEYGTVHLARARITFGIQCVAVADDAVRLRREMGAAFGAGAA